MPWLRRRKQESYACRTSAIRFIVNVISFGLALSVPPNPAFAEDAEQMRLAAHQLIAAQMPSGLLDFDFNFLDGKGQDRSKSNLGQVAFIGRQSGTTFVLAKYYAWSKDDAMVVPVGRLLQTLGSLSVPIGKSRAQGWLEKTGILSLPVGRYKLQRGLQRLNLLYEPTGPGRLVTLDARYDLAWAGTTALALLAELNYFRADHDNRFADLRASWLAGLMVLHVPGEGFRGYPESIDQVPYSDGEIWLALSTFVETFPQDAEIQAVLRGYDDYMIRIYSASPSEDFFSWGAMAAATRLDTTSDAKFTNFIRAQARHFLERETEWPAGDNSCSFVEGLAAASRALSTHGDNDAQLIHQLFERIDREMTKNRALQIVPGHERLDFSAGAYLWAPRLADYGGAFLAATDNPYTRIDYTAHCISAGVELSRIAISR